jgi:hypothetical protein
MKKSISVYLFILIALIAFFGYSLFNNFMVGFLLNLGGFDVLPPLFDSIIIVLYVGLSLMLYGTIMLFLPTNVMKCSNCTMAIKKIVQNRSVKIISSTYKYTNKDGTKNRKRKDNIALHAWQEKYHCIKCGYATTLEEYGEMPYKIYKEAKKSESSLAEEIITNGEGYNVVIIAVNHGFKMKLSDHLKNTYGGLSAEYVTKIINLIYKSKIPYRIDRVYTKGNAKVEAAILDASMGAQAVYIPHNRKWNDLSVDETRAIVKKALKSNSQPTENEMEDWANM